MKVPAPTTIDVQILDHPVQPASVDPFPESAGAECLFLGRTRREVHPDHGPLRRLSYQAYLPLARSSLAELARLAADRFDCRVVRIHHAVGDVPVGSASVLIQVVCGHRGSAFDACRFLIDRLKVTVPIWKQETWTDGTTWARGRPVEP